MKGSISRLKKEFLSLQLPICKHNTNRFKVEHKVAILKGNNIALCSSLLEQASLTRVLPDTVTCIFLQEEVVFLASSNHRMELASFSPNKSIYVSSCYNNVQETAKSEIKSAMFWRERVILLVA